MEIKPFTTGYSEHPLEPAPRDAACIDAVKLTPA
jgi:hypothetical protein